MLPTRINLQLPSEQPLFFDDFITRDNWKAAEGQIPMQVVPMPATNVIETEDVLVIELIVPGLSAEDLTFLVTDNSVEVRYEPDINSFEAFNSQRFHQREYRPMAFTRRYELNPQALDFDGLEVESDQGIVRIEIPKLEQFRGRVQPFMPFSLN